MMTFSFSPKILGRNILMRFLFLFLFFVLFCFVFFFVFVSLGFFCVCVCVCVCVLFCFVLFFLFLFLLIMKGNDNYNIHKKFQVHSTNVLWIRSKNKYREVVTTTTPNFDSLSYSYHRVWW